MTIINPKSIAGVTSITTASGADNLLTVHTNNTTERIRINNDGDVIVGSGITVSPDGDIFTTGVTTSTTFVGALTGNVTGNISGGTVAGSTGTFTGNVAVSGANITLQDSGGASDDRLVIGAGTDLSIYHDSTDSIISNATGDLYINNTGGSSDDIHIQAADDILLRPQGGENGIKVIGDGAVELYQNNVLKVTTADEGLIVYSGSGAGSNTGNVISVKGGTSARTAPGIYMEGGTGGDNSSIHAKYNLRLGCNSGNDISGREVQFTNGDTNLASLNSNGDFEIDNGNVVIQTSGKGIDFSATSNGGTGSVDELLDDYEEGTFAPAFKAGNASNNSNTSVQEARYIKIGSLVYITFFIDMNAHGDNTGGSAFITGLPFTNSNRHSSVSIGYFNVLLQNQTIFTGTIQPSSSQILLRHATSASTSTSSLDYSNAIGTSSEMIVSATYSVV